jgi:phage tail sheath protein FI
MPEYLAPGVYVEEVSFRAKSIEGVGTTTTGFVGPTRYGPVDITPDVVTSLGEFERTYGDRQQLVYGGSILHNFMWHAARAFFEEGGQLLYVSRTYTPSDSTNPDSGKASKIINSGGTRTIPVKARFPGAAGNFRVRFTVHLGTNSLGQDSSGNATVRGVLDNDVVLIQRVSSPLSPLSGTFALATSWFDVASQTTQWTFTPATGATFGTSPAGLNPLHADPNPVASDQVQVVTLTVTVYPLDPNLATLVYDGLALDRRHLMNGSADSMEDLFSATPDSLALARSLPIVVTDTNASTGLNILDAMFAHKPGLQAAVLDPTLTDVDRSFDLVLTGGSDGLQPDSPSYEGNAPVGGTTKTGLKAFEDIDEISIVAAPGSTFGYQANPALGASIISLLIAHCELMRYRIAVVDCGDGQAVADVRAMRGQFDSTYAAFYYPWVKILDPVTRREINVPPSGFVAGIYARNDINRGVYKAPANEVVTLALTFETVLNKAQQDILNPLGVNCFRYFEGRGNRLWGARTMSSDPEWKYVNLRRYFAYLEHSIDKGTQWAVFEPNGDRLWANVRRTIMDFLLNEWQTGALLGDKPEKAYFVKCDRSTMTQNDLDNGRLVCLIGVSPLRPAEFVIFRIGQWTADSK